MPPRLNKRQQRELEELEELKSANQEQDGDASETDDLPGPSRHRGASAFANVSVLIYVCDWYQSDCVVAHSCRR